jgi:23S rRNA (uracil1939-C5)-methyltransferase
MKTEVVRLDKIVPGGQALGTLPDGRKVFVWGGLPDETVKIEIIKNKNSYAEAVVAEVIEASPHRTTPRDTCYLSTSPWQIMDYDYELGQKTELVREVFRQQEIFSGMPGLASNRQTVDDETPRGGDGLAREDLDSNTIVTDHKDFFYRNKMEYSLWWDNDTNRISLAFHKRGTHTKIPTASSSIERPEIFAEAMRIVNQLNTKKEPARKYQSLLVRSNQDGEVAGALFEKGQPHPQIKTLSDKILGYKYSYSPNGFFQINLPVYELALQEISRHLGNNEKVVDMYAGVGTIGLSVARDRNLTLVETDKSAFNELKNNITSDIKNNVTPVLARSEEALGYITGDITLIVDPPRAGLDEKVVGQILEALPPRVIYLSCNPSTQARDVAKLLAKYKIVHQQAFNFFPRTPHIENLIVLHKY